MMPPDEVVPKLSAATRPTAAPIRIIVMMMRAFFEIKSEEKAYPFQIVSAIPKKKMTADAIPVPDEMLASFQIEVTSGDTKLSTS